jgi:hypothetical protein
MTQFRGKHSSREVPPFAGTFIASGGGGIRTLDGPKWPITVFETCFDPTETRIAKPDPRPCATLRHTERHIQPRTGPGAETAMALLDGTGVRMLIHDLAMELDRARALVLSRELGVASGLLASQPERW